MPPFNLPFFQTNGGNGGGSSSARSFHTFRISSCPGTAIQCDVVMALLCAPLCLMPAACLAFFLSFSSSSSARSAISVLLWSYKRQTWSVPAPLFDEGFLCRVITRRRSVVPVCDGRSVPVVRQKARARHCFLQSLAYSRCRHQGSDFSPVLPLPHGPPALVCTVHTPSQTRPLLFFVSCF